MATMLLSIFAHGLSAMPGINRYGSSMSGDSEVGPMVQTILVLFAGSFVMLLTYRALCGSSWFRIAVWAKRSVPGIYYLVLIWLGTLRFAQPIDCSLQGYCSLD